MLVTGYVIAFSAHSAFVLLHISTMQSNETEQGIAREREMKEKRNVISITCKHHG